jgi:pilus assembly protein CpaF
MFNKCYSYYMAQDSESPKFPAPIPNPLAQSPDRVDDDDDVTDPHITTSLNSREELTEVSPSPPTPILFTPDISDAQTQAIQAPGPGIRMPEMGPLDALMKDPEITEIMINDVRNVMVEKGGKIQFSGFNYQTIEDLNRLTRSILDITGRNLSPENPYVDVMLPDGSRVNIVAPPLTSQGPCITIRKFPARRLGIQELMKAESLDQRMAYFLNACVVGRLNLMISGGTGSGKTTLLNALAAMIPKSERIITIEDTPELAIQHANSVRLQTKPQTSSSAPVTARDLVTNSLRMRPDRIIVGECRKAEAFDMLQAMNTGHEGSMTTLHANSPRDALARLETLCMLAGVDLPLLAIRKQITSAIDLIIQIKRSRNGKRRITAVSEVVGMEGEVITMQDIFLYEIDINNQGNNETGIFKVTGSVPTFMDRLREQGVELPRHYFGV